MLEFGQPTGCCGSGKWKIHINGFKYLLSDEFFLHHENVPKEVLIKKSDVIVLAVPHTNYNKCKIPKSKKIIDIWGFFEK